MKLILILAIIGYSAIAVAECAGPVVATSTDGAVIYPTENVYEVRAFGKGYLGYSDEISSLEKQIAFINNEIELSKSGESKSTNVSSSKLSQYGRISIITYLLKTHLKELQ